jgi:alpha-tubulin suppressor-like RCC1 family protein
VNKIFITSSNTWYYMENKFSGGYMHYAIKTDGTLWAWGNNDGGALGQNNSNKFSSPVQIPGTTWVMLNMVEMVLLAALKLMEHYGHGEIMMMDN